MSPSQGKADKLLPGVNLPPGSGASSTMLALLHAAVKRFPTTFDSVKLPSSSQAFKTIYARLLIEVEQRRCASPERSAIASWLQRRVAESLVLRDHRGNERPLGSLDLEAAPLRVEHRTSSHRSGWTPELSYAGRQWRGTQLVELIDRLEAAHRCNALAAHRLRRLLSRLTPCGELKLHGERFAILGAGAEIGPTEVLLRAGATVLWLDVRAPPAHLDGIGGELHHTGGQGDLLRHPDRIAATIGVFADPHPAHLGLFAYGPGRGREWRLGAAMIAVLRAISREQLRSVGLFVSPATPIELHEDDARLVTERLETVTGWRSLCTRARLLTRHRALPELPRVSDSIVPLQGVSYQAAQWLEKTVAMEALAAEHSDLPISANVAPITQTQSMAHPIFRAAFRGATAFDVESFPSEFTRTLASLLYVEDILSGASLDPCHVHGGVLTLPFSLESALKIAVGVGLLRRSPRRPNGSR